MNRLALLILFGSFFIASCSSGDSKTTGTSALPSITTVGGIVDLRTFKVVGNGRTDDTLTFQAALDSANPGDEIPLLNLVVTLTQSAILRKNNVTLRGPGTIRIGGVGKFFALQIEAQAVTVKDLKIENPTKFSVDFVRNGCPAGDVAENHTGGIIIKAAYAQVIGNTLDGLVTAIQALPGTATPSNISILNNTITNLLGTNAECNGGDGIHLEAKNSLVHGNTIQQNPTEASSNGISILGSGSFANQISRNNISGNFTRSILVDNAVPVNTIPVTAGFHQVVLNEIDGAGIEVKNATETSVSGNTLILAPYAESSIRSGILVNQAPFTMVHRNFLHFNSNRVWDAGILLNQSSESRADSNEIERDAGVTTDFLIANAIYSNASNLAQIEKNNIEAKISEVGIRLNGGTNVFVRNNQVRDTQDFLIHIMGSNGAILSDNLLIKSPNGINVQTSNDILFEGNTLQQLENAGDGISLTNSNNALLRSNSIEIPRCGFKNTTSTGLRIFSNTVRYKAGAGERGLFCGTPVPVNAAYATENTAIAIP